MEQKKRERENGNIQRMERGAQKIKYNLSECVRLWGLCFWREREIYNDDFVFVIVWLLSTWRGWCAKHVLAHARQRDVQRTRERTPMDEPTLLRVPASNGDRWASSCTSGWVRQARRSGGCGGGSCDDDDDGSHPLPGGGAYVGIASSAVVVVVALDDGISWGSDVVVVVVDGDHRREKGTGPHGSGWVPCTQASLLLPPDRAG